jgi:hypothetical protein
MGALAPAIFGHFSTVAKNCGCYEKSPSFGKSYSTRNILPRFVQKSPSFGQSYSTRNILTRFVWKSPSFGKSYSTRNILPRFVQKCLVLANPTVLEIFYQDLYRKALYSFGKSYSTRNILPRFVQIIQKP